MWGTCLGFQFLSFLVAGKDLLTTTDAANLPLPLHLISPGITAVVKALLILGEIYFLTYTVCKCVSNHNINCSALMYLTQASTDCVVSRVKVP